MLATVTLGVVTATGLCVGTAACGHTHNMQWKSENGMHWQECSDCEEKSTPEAHKDDDHNLVCDVCGDTLTPSTIHVTSVTVTGAATVGVGQHITLSAAVLPTNATNRTVSWSSSDTTKATVNASTGEVTGVAAGTVTITATAGGKTGTKTITVTANSQSKVDVESVTVSGANEVAVGANITLTAAITPSDATNQTVTWDIQPAGIATIDANGVVTGVTAGTAYVMATADGINSQLKEITVKAPTAVTGVTLNQSSATLTVGGGTLTLTETVAPNDATNKAVSWSSSNDGVATVADGVVTAVAAGQATITVTTEDGSYTADCVVTVEPAPVAVESVTITEGASGKLAVGGTVTLHATVAPSDATNKTVAWASKNAAVATVDASTGAVTAVSRGTAEITATAGGVSATYTLTVQNKYDELLESGVGTVIHNEDFNGEFTGGKLGTFGGNYGTKGVYGSQNGKDGATDETNYVAVTKKEANGYADLVDPDVAANAGNGAGAATTMNWAFGALKGEIEGYAEFTFVNGGTGWTPIQFTSLGGSELFRIRYYKNTNQNNRSEIAYSADGGATYVSAITLITPENNKAYEMYFKVSADNKLTVTIDGKDFAKDIALAETLGGIKFTSSDGVSEVKNSNPKQYTNKKMTIDNVIVRGTEMTAEEYATYVKASAQSKLDAEKAKYPETSTEAGAKVYSINIGEINAAYDAAKEVIDRVGATADEMNAAVSTAIAAMKAVEDDKTVTDARAAAITELRAYKNAEDYDTENAATLAEKITAGETAINSAKNTAAVTAALTAAKTEIDGITTKAQQLAAAIAQAKQDLVDYKVADIEAMTDADLKAQITDPATGLKAEGAKTLEAVTDIANVDSTLKAITDEIDEIIASDGVDVGVVISDKKNDLTAYANTAKAGVAADFQTAIDNIVKKYNGDATADPVVKGLFDDCTKNSEVTAKYEEAVAEIDAEVAKDALVKAKAAAVIEIEGYRDTLKAQFYLETAKALFDTECTAQVATINEATSEEAIDIDAAKAALDAKKTDATNLELAARATWTGEDTGEETDEIIFANDSRFNSGKAVTAGDKFGTNDWLVLTANNGSTKWKQEKSGQKGISAQAGGTFTVTVPANGATLYIKYYSTNSSRNLIIKQGTTEKYNNNSSAWTTAGGSIDLAEGTYTIDFTGGEHKLESMKLVYETTKTVTKPVHKVAATKTADGFDVKITLDNDNGSVKTLTAGEYTVIEEADKYIVIFGADKTAADANKYNSCTVAKA